MPAAGVGPWVPAPCVWVPAVPEGGVGACVCVHETNRETGDPGP